MSQTAAFIARLTDNRHFGLEERARLRSLFGRGLDVHPAGFDLFTGLWWPLRQKNQAAPRREVAWLVAKLYAALPLPNIRPEGGQGPTLAQALGRCEPRDEVGRERFRRKFDAMLETPLGGLEPHLLWGLSVVRDAVAARRSQGIDWVQLTDDLAIWDRGEAHRRQRDVRKEWAAQYLNIIT